MGGVKGHNINDITLPGSRGLWAVSFTSLGRVKHNPQKLLDKSSICNIRCPKMFLPKFSNHRMVVLTRLSVFLIEDLNAFKKSRGRRVLKKPGIRNGEAKLFCLS
jgi:hypothetical protein